MNKRIKELAEQVYGTQATDQEQKFAELIVKECAKVIFETQVDYIEIDVMHRIRDRVKEHFGVTE